MTHSIANRPTEADLFRGYQPNGAAHDHVLRVVIEERIAELWRWRTWDREHMWAEWTTSRTERTVELRALVRLARKARSLAATAPDPIDAYRSGLDRGRGYHDVQAR